MYRFTLEQALGPYREKTGDSDWPVRSLALHVLRWLVKDLLGTRVEVQLMLSVVENI
jgi:hypothetical protein